MVYTINVYGHTYKVNVLSTRYTFYNSLAVVMETVNEEPFATITVNLPDSKGLKENLAFIDTNNCPWAVDFLTENKIAIDTGVRASSGYCTYPLFEFDMSKLSMHSFLW